MCSLGSGSIWGSGLRIQGLGVQHGVYGDVAESSWDRKSTMCSYDAMIPQRLLTNYLP